MTQFSLDSVEAMTGNVQFDIGDTAIQVNPAGGLGAFLITNDVVLSVASAFAIAYLYPDGILSPSEDGGDAGGDGGGTEPEPDPGTDPEPDPDPDPDPGPDPEPTILELLIQQQGTWTEGTRPAYIEVKVVDRYVSVSLARGTERVYTTMDQVATLVPNDVRVVGMSRQALDAEVNVSYGENLFGLLDGNPAIDPSVSGFYLAEYFNRDAVVAMDGSTATIATAYVGVGSWAYYLTPLGDTDVTVVNTWKRDGSNGADLEISRSYRLNFGKSIDNSGGMDPVGSLGDLIREISVGTDCYTAPGSHLVWGTNDQWGRGTQRFHYPNSNLDKLATIVRDKLVPGFKVGEQISFKDLALHYIDNQAVRDEWDGISVIDIPVTLIVYDQTFQAPYLDYGDQPL